MGVQSTSAMFGISFDRRNAGRMYRATGGGVVQQKNREFGLSLVNRLNYDDSIRQSIIDSRTLEVVHP
jgi:hypothetical protein